MNLVTLNNEEVFFFRLISGDSSIPGSIFREFKMEAFRSPPGFSATQGALILPRKVLHYILPEG
jgi:hypothetical protein